MYNDYHVTWEIDIGAKSPRDAAKAAFEIVQRPTSSVVFLVTDATGETQTIDLEEDDGDG